METSIVPPKLILASKLSPLVGDINWMETGIPPYVHSWSSLNPHSLGILIEWKQRTKLICVYFTLAKSPLVGDINWMETSPQSIFGRDFDTLRYPHSLGILIEWKHWFAQRLLQIILSPLVGDINWMETLVRVSIRPGLLHPHSLGILIEWKQKS